MVEGLACMHGKGLAHADLRTGNVLVDEKGRAKLADFGNVKKVLTYLRSICLIVFFFKLKSTNFKFYLPLNRLCLYDV